MSKWFILFFKFRAIVFATTIRFLGFILNTPLPQKISAGAFIEKDGKFLVLDIVYRKGYSVPGGMIDPGESVEKGLIREIKEETGLECKEMTYIGSKDDIQYGYPTLALAFKVEVEGELIDSNEGSLLWLTSEEILKNSAYKNWEYLFKLYLRQHESTCD